MPVQTSFPGIYIEELPSSAHTITAAPTSITVFVGYTHPFKTNPSNFNQATEIFSFSDYERAFGGAYESGLIDSNVADAVNMFFLNGGADAFVVALEPKNYTDNTGNSNSQAVNKKGATGVVAETLEFGAGSRKIKFTAREPVDSVPMTVTITNPQTASPLAIATITEAGGTATATLTPALTNIAVGDSVTISGNSVAGYNGVFTVASVNPGLKEFTFAAAPGLGTGTGGSVAGNASADIVISYGSQTETYRKVNLLPGDSSFIATRIGTAVDISSITRSGNVVTVTTAVDSDFRAGQTIAIAGASDTSFNGTFTVNPTPAPTATQFTFTQSGPDAASPATPGTVLYPVPTVSSLVTVSADTSYPSTFPFPAGKMTASQTTNFSKPAGALGVFDPADFIPVFQADSALDKVPIFNLVVVPGIINTAVLSEALAFCERKFAFLIMDPPVIDVADGSSNSYIGKFIDQSGDANSNVAPLSQNGALYFPYLQSFDPITANPINLPPGGFVAGIFARTDTNRGVWKAPAGLETTIVDTTGVVTTGLMTDPRQGDLNNKGVNCLRSFSTGTVVFGARTLVSSNPAYQQWKYVPVRRMALFIEQTLRANLTWVIFEPNDTPLWTAIRTSIEGFMLSLFNQGALQGSTPSQAFQVKCDSSTTTQDDINNGIVNIIVAFAPLKPAEFVVIKIAQLAGQAQS